MTRKAKWDKHQIKAEIYRRGQSLTSLEECSGLNKGDCSAALSRPFLRAERVIAAFLDLPLYELWPDRWDQEGLRIKYLRRPIRQPMTRATKNRVAQAAARNDTMRPDRHVDRG